MLVNRPELKNFLVVSGSGRNVGKTTLACSLIHQLSLKTEVIGVKISPHLHNNPDNLVILTKSENVRIFLENNPATNKDSSRMLRSGASKVYYIECNDEGIEEAIVALNKTISYKIPVVCESGALGYLSKPGFHILIDSNKSVKKASYNENKRVANIIIDSDKVIDYHDSIVEFENGSWKFNLTNSD